MGLFGFKRRPDINDSLNEYNSSPGAVLLDVRAPSEYRSGHIPGSINVSLQYIDNIEDTIDNKDTPLYVYCHSGIRSSQAVAELQEMGYTNVKNIGGIAAYTGKVEAP